MTNQTTILQFSQRLYSAFLKAGVPDANARILIGQARHETANFSSNVFKKNNNCFGMKVPSVRKSPYILGSGTNAPANEGPTPYAKYASIEDSAKDLLHWLHYNNVNWSAVNTPATYASFLKSKNYYGPTASFYGNAISVFVDQMKDWVLKNKKKTIVLAAGVILVGIGIYIWAKSKNNLTAA